MGYRRNKLINSLVLGEWPGEFMITGVHVAWAAVDVGHCAFAPHSFLREPTGN